MNPPSRSGRLSKETREPSTTTRSARSDEPLGPFWLYGRVPGGAPIKPETAARPFWLSCWSDFHFDWLDHPSWPDPAGIDLAFRWDRSRTRSSETTQTLSKHKPAETPVFSTRQAFRQGSRFGSMTNPTDAGGENPTIRDVSPPSDTYRPVGRLTTCRPANWRLSLPGFHSQPGGVSNRSIRSCGNRPLVESFRRVLTQLPSR